MKSSKAIRLQLVDDQFFVRTGLAAALNAEPDMEVVAEAGSVAEAIEEYRRQQPDVVMMDHALPDGTGIDALKMIRVEFPDAVVVMLTINETEESVFHAINAGAAGYLAKSVPRGELLSAVRQVAAGGSVLPADLAYKLQQRRLREELSPRELEILKLVVGGTPNKLISDALGLAEKTVKWHMTNIFEKLNVMDRTSAATAALKRGIIALE